MKTPEEIKKGLECCKPQWKSDHFVTCNAECPYRFEGAFCRTVLNADAITYIQQLEAQVPKWISVEERLPEDKVLVLTYDHLDGISASYYSEAMGAFYPYIGSEFCGAVTHWMPLPEPPKEGT